MGQCKSRPERAGAVANGDCGKKQQQKQQQASEEQLQQQLRDDVRIVFVLGGPGAGKGTQCAKLVEAYGFTHLSAGDLLREEVASGSAVGEECAAIMREGKLVPMEVTIGLLRKAMVEAGARDFLIDGFPRALDQAERFEALVKPCEAVLFFDCPEEVMEARLLKRGETSGRADDNAETIRKRFRTFVEQSVPVVGRYEALGKAHRVEATRAPHEVFADVQAIVDRLRAASPVVPAPAAAVKLAVKQQQQQAEAVAPVAVTAAAPALAFA